MIYTNHYLLISLKPLKILLPYYIKSLILSKESKNRQKYFFEYIWLNIFGINQSESLINFLQA